MKVVLLFLSLMKTARAQPILPDEVFTEILSWLPVKKLVQFRCVCKFCNSLISDPQFVKLHLQRSPKNANKILTLNIPASFGVDNYKCAISCSLSSILQNSYYADHDGYLRLNCSLKCRDTVLGSCNGLVCLHSSSCKGVLREYWVRFWNPEMGLQSKNSPSLCVDLRVNELTYPRFGFGYDKSSDTYKVVAVALFDDKNSKGASQVKVYNMGDHCWRDIQPFPAFPIESPCEGKLLSCSLNWLAFQNFGSGYKSLVIVSLDLEKETYKKILLPNDLHKTFHFAPRIEVLGDCLCLLYDYERTHIVVLQMKEFGVEKSWTQFVNVSYQHLQIERPFQFFSLEPLCISIDGDVLMFLNHSFQVIMYNRRDNSVEKAEYRSNRGWNNFSDNAKDHVQSLILPC